MTLDERGKLLTGGSIGAVVALLEGLGVAALGVNCGWARSVQALMPELTAVTSVPIVVSPNAGLPHSVDGKTVFTVGPEDFASSMAPLPRAAPAVGGCCGTTPAHIEKMIEAAAGHKPTPLSDKG